LQGIKKLIHIVFHNLWIKYEKHVEKLIKQGRDLRKIAS
jgi:hypothetical protein